MYTPKERVELLIAMLGEQLNEHGHFFKISKTRLSWRNKDVAMIVAPRGCHYSTAECTTRWLRIRIESHALRKLRNCGAPIRDNISSGTPQEIFEDDLRNGHSLVEVELRDWWSIEEAAKRLAAQFDRNWESQFRPWINIEQTIEFLSYDRENRICLTPLLTPHAPPAGSPELEAMIHRLSPPQAKVHWSLLGELLLAAARIDDLRRLEHFCRAASESGNGRATREHPYLIKLIHWSESTTKD